MSFYLGIDPGLSGALAFYDPVYGDLRVFDMPTHTVKSGGKNKRRIDMHGLAAIVRNHAPDTQNAMLEEVSAMPGQGVTSMFSFGKSAGAAEMALAALGVRYEMIAPVVWKRAMKVTGNKDEARRMASRLLPKHAEHWQLVKHDGRAEAALLAYYTAQRHNVTLPREKGQLW